MGVPLTSYWGIPMMETPRILVLKPTQVYFPTCYLLQIIVQQFLYIYDIASYVFLYVIIIPIKQY